jgi:hypothetical protein
VSYYNRVCESLGLNPLTRPFEFINLSGKLVFYARRDCTDQLRNINNVTVRIVSREKLGEDVYVVTAQATLPNGRSDESTGAVPIARLQGETLANALMKAETKAKRRVTLSICGLSVLDESELDGVRDQTHPPRISSHDDGGASTDSLDPDMALDLLSRMNEIESAVKAADSYDKALAARARLGTSEKQSELTKAIQAAVKEPRAITVEEHKELSKIWQRCNRQCAKLEKELAPPAEASFQDLNEGDPAEDFDR